ncbi:MAG: hypothetical protein ACPGU5_03240 [Lishizhenia sp.]
MKKLLLFLPLLCFSFYSCQSEYDRQMLSAKYHKQKLEALKDSLDRHSIEAIESEIYFCAELSGAKTTFLQELELLP